MRERQTLLRANALSSLGACANGTGRGFIIAVGKRWLKSATDWNLNVRLTSAYHGEIGQKTGSVSHNPSGTEPILTCEPQGK